jgi:hypothetical protein
VQEQRQQSRPLYLCKYVEKPRRSYSSACFQRARPAGLIITQHPESETLTRLVGYHEIRANSSVPVQEPQPANSMSRFSGNLSGELVSLVLTGIKIRDCESFFAFWKGQQVGSVADRACHSMIVTAYLIHETTDDMDLCTRNDEFLSWREMHERGIACTEDDFDEVDAQYIENNLPSKIMEIVDKMLGWVLSGCDSARDVNHLPALFTHDGKGAKFAPVKATQAFPQAFHIVYKQNVECKLSEQLTQQINHDRSAVVNRLLSLAEQIDNDRVDTESELYTFCCIEYNGTAPSVSQGGRFSDFVRAMAEHVAAGNGIEDFIYL